MLLVPFAIADSYKMKLTVKVEEPVERSLLTFASSMPMAHHQLHDISVADNAAECKFLNTTWFGKKDNPLLARYVHYQSNHSSPRVGVSANE